MDDASKPPTEGASGDGGAPGIGGVFLRCRDPERLKGWYREYLDLPVEGDGPVVLRWREHERPEREGSTILGFFPQDTEYFGRPEAACMVNYRVPDLGAALERMRAAGVDVDERVEESEYGRFGWATDPEGNRFELWEPPAGM